MTLGENLQFGVRRDDRVRAGSSRSTLPMVRKQAEPSVSLGRSSDEHDSIIVPARNTTINLLVLEIPWVANEP